MVLFRDKGIPHDSTPNPQAPDTSSTGGVDEAAGDGDDPHACSGCDDDEGGMEAPSDDEFLGDDAPTMDPEGFRSMFEALGFEVIGIEDMRGRDLPRLLDEAITATHRGLTTLTGVKVERWAASVLFGGLLGVAFASMSRRKARRLLALYSASFAAGYTGMKGRIALFDSTGFVIGLALGINGTFLLTELASGRRDEILSRAAAAAASTMIRTHVPPPPRGRSVPYAGFEFETPDTDEEQPEAPREPKAPQGPESSVFSFLRDNPELVLSVINMTAPTILASAPVFLDALRGQLFRRPARAPEHDDAEANAKEGFDEDWAWHNKPEDGGPEANPVVSPELDELIRKAGMKPPHHTEPSN